MELSLNATTIVLSFIAIVILQRVSEGIYNLTFHPLCKFPGPKLAALTQWYQTYQEVYQQNSMVDILKNLYLEYGSIVRIGPNQLHFSSPSAYHDIYTSRNRWNKEEKLYHSFGEDRSSFGFLTYSDAKQRRDILAPLFSRRAILNLEGLVQGYVDKLCSVLEANHSNGKSSDLFLGLRCFTIDTVTSFCFARSVDALSEPDFRAPIIIAMELSMPKTIIFKHFKFVQQLGMNMPPWLARKMSPWIEGMLELQAILEKQVKEVVRNPEILEGEGHEIIYHQLLDKKNGVIGEESLYEEAQALMFGGTDTVGNTVMLGVFYILENPQVLERLCAELREFWPVLDEKPKFEELQRLPYLTAVIKEALRITPGVASSLLRVVPEGGASISEQQIPAGTIVGVSGIFVHNAEDIFPSPSSFNPDRWLSKDSENLDKYLVAFSKGPRQCIGQNLAYCELYLSFAALFRRFNMKLDGTTAADFEWRECFLPYFRGRHLQVFCEPVTT